MLTDIPTLLVAALNKAPAGGNLLAVLDAIGGNPNKDRIVRLDTGMYEIQHFSLDHLIGHKRDGGLVTEDYPFMDHANSRTYPDAFGVCDTPAQLLEKYPILATCEGQHVVSMTAVRKAEQGEGGWRWHKWGPYIGDKTPSCEYLRDEPDIDEVWVFHIYGVEV